jgi:HlyD family secretion protein
VIAPGTALMTLVPQGETLRAEVWMTNQDVGFLRPGR